MTSGIYRVNKSYCFIAAIDSDERPLRRYALGEHVRLKRLGPFFEAYMPESRVGVAYYPPMSIPTGNPDDPFTGIGAIVTISGRSKKAVQRVSSEKLSPNKKN